MVVLSIHCANGYIKMLSVLPTLDDCLREIAKSHICILNCIQPHKPVVATLDRYLSRLDVIALHGAFIDKYWHKSTDPVVCEVQRIMLMYNRHNVLLRLSWRADVIATDRVERAIEYERYDLVELYAGLMLQHGFDEMWCLARVNERMLAGPCMRMLMRVMPKMLLKFIACRHIRINDNVTRDILQCLSARSSLHSPSVHGRVVSYSCGCLSIAVQTWRNDKPHGIWLYGCRIDDELKPYM